MDVSTTPSYETMQSLYYQYFSIGNLNADINTKFALISLICYLTKKLQEKKPDVTHYQVISKISDGIIPLDKVKSLAIICSDFSYGCTEFPTFGIEDKNIPTKVREILSKWLPF